MTAVIIQIRDCRRRRLEKKAAEVMGQVLDYTEIARLGGPGGIDDLVFADTAPCEMVHYHNGDSGDCA